MTIEGSQGVLWICGMLAAIPILRQAWLFYRDVKKDISGPVRMPPLAEEVAKTYVTRPEWEKCKIECKNTQDCIREEIKANDRQAEARAKGTHRRIDEVLKTQQKSNRQLGILIGLNMANDKGAKKLVCGEEEELEC